jgi:SAM-dependent methyltransferase
MESRAAISIPAVASNRTEVIRESSRDAVPACSAKRVILSVKSILVGQVRPIDLDFKPAGCLYWIFGEMTTEAYNRDLAYVHDVGFGSFAERAAPGVLNILRGSGISNGLVIDLGCGGGLWARRLVDAGYEVLGMDLSPHMITIARQRVPEGTFRRASFLDGGFPSCAAITSLGECFNYLFDDRNRRSSLCRLFRQAHRALQPGGLLIFDVVEPGRARGSDRRFWKGRDWACLTEFDHDRRRDLLTRRITTFRKVGRQYRRAEETHVQQLYRGSQLAGDLREIGFRVRTIRGYGALRFLKAQVGLIARRP